MALRSIDLCEAKAWPDCHALLASLVSRCHCGAVSRLPVLGLLAPVPEAHLVDGVEVCGEQGKVAFGTRVWDAFRDLELAAGPGAPVLIYASHAAMNLGPIATWAGRFVGWVGSIGGRHPDEDLYRPPSTQSGDEDRSGYWLGFWEVSDLHPLPKDEQLRISTLSGVNGRKFRADFIPEGPTLLTGLGAYTARRAD
jgi:hypothetical protein